MIAALYIDSKRGPYAAMPGVDAWGIERDATQYAGPWPVVAHPPCKSWGSLRHLALPNQAERDCGPRAVEQVRRWGGVLEQPAHSQLWAACGLPRPGELPDSFGGWSIEVSQCDFGHLARKRTWLYIVGCRPDCIPALPPAREPTHWGQRHIHAREARHGSDGNSGCSTSPAPPDAIGVRGVADRRRQGQCKIVCATA